MVQLCNRLTVDSFLQYLLPEILANMSGILHSVAKNMDAKDQRFISQGVYNLLFGTVELLMVSAEESAVTRDSGTFTADQLKVRCCIQNVQEAAIVCSRCPCAELSLGLVLGCVRLAL